MNDMDFDSAYQRICSATGKRTQQELAAYFGIRQSSVSFSKRRKVIPDSWLLALVEKDGISPAWVRFGSGPVYLADCAPIAAAALSNAQLFAELRKRFPEGLLLPWADNPVNVVSV